MRLHQAMERQPMQPAAGGLAASAFIAVTQILTRTDALDLPLIIALTLFAAMIPFQIFIFYAPPPPAYKNKNLTQSQIVYWNIHRSSTVLVLAGFVALFWHFFWCLGVVFAVAAFGAYLAFRFCAYSQDYMRQ